MTDTAARRRQAAGTPVGGQFATEARTEPDVSLAAPAPAPAPVVLARPQDTAALDEIACDLGGVAEWDAFEHSEEAAYQIERTGRPHPGGRFDDPEDYVRELDAWIAESPVPEADARRDDWATLNALARTMAETEHWGVDLNEHLSAIVAASGRPHPGDTEPDITDDEELARVYADRVRQWRAAQGLETDLRFDHEAVERVQEDRPALAAALDLVIDRGSVDEDVWIRLDDEQARDLEDRLEAPFEAVAQHIAAKYPTITRWPEGEAHASVRQAAAEAGLSSAGEMIVANRHLSPNDMGALTAQDITEIYDKHLGPAVDDIEVRLLAAR